MSINIFFVNNANGMALLSLAPDIRYPRVSHLSLENLEKCHKNKRHKNSGPEVCCKKPASPSWAASVFVISFPQERIFSQELSIYKSPHFKKKIVFFKSCFQLKTNIFSEFYAKYSPLALLSWDLHSNTAATFFPTSFWSSEEFH